MSKSKAILLTLTFASLLFSFAFCENDVALVVNGDSIYRDELDYALAKYEADSGPVSDEIKEKLTDGLIDSQLYLQEAERRGITAKVFAGEEEIEELLMSKPQASQEAKNERDRAEKIILRYKMREIIPSKVIAAIKEEVTENDKGFLDEYQKRAEKMRVKYIKIDPVPLAGSMEISEDEVKTFYDDHGDQFERPAVNRYAVLYFDPRDYIGMVSVTPQMLTEHYKEHADDFKSDKLVKVKYVLFRTKDYSKQVYSLGVNSKQYYDDNLDKFVEPAEARIRVISMKKPCSKKKIRSLESELKQGVPFPELAKKYSDDISTASNGGDLGYIKAGTLKEPYDTIAFDLDSGQVSKVIETDNNYCVLSVEEKKDVDIIPFDEVSGRIEEQLLNEAAKPLVLADAKRFKIEAKKTGFEKAATRKSADGVRNGLFQVIRQGSDDRKEPVVHECGNG
ncbi:MAG: peptidylprolyl isomerase, partial [bacterium]